MADSIATRAAAADSPAALAEALRLLRRREARDRDGPLLTYRDIAKATGWSVGSVGNYFAGAAVAPADRFDELVRLLGARPGERSALATARDRVSGRRIGADTELAPRALPAAVRGFSGRTAELAWLDGLLSRGLGAAPVAISAITGMGGVGKTALAVCWAHRVAGQFPGGQLYVNLRGYDPVEPLTTSDALATLLLALGVSPPELPDEVADRSALYRRLLSERRALVLLDNGRDAEQVRPLLPPPPCLAVVTSRDALADLVAADGARMLTLKALSEPEAVALLRLLLGPRADHEAGAVRELARRCGRLPLALRVAAEQVDMRRGLALADLTAEIEDAIAATPEATGDHSMSLRAVFSWSLRHLPDQVAHGFWLLGLIPTADIDTFGLAALLGLNATGAERVARALNRAHLLQRDPSGRWSMHDLLRGYAAECVREHAAAPDCDAAVGRLLDYYLATSAAAVRKASPHLTFTEEHRRSLPAWRGAAPTFDDASSAVGWLVREGPNLVRVAMHAHAHGWHEHAVTFGLTLLPFLEERHELNGVRAQPVAMVADAADPFERASLLTGLAVTRWRLGEVDAAADLAERAFAAFSALDTPLGMSRAIYVLGAVRERQGRPDEAMECFQRGAEIARSAGLQVTGGWFLDALGLTERR